MLKISYAGCFGLSPATSAQFTHQMCVAVQYREKCTKIPYFEGSRSFKVIDLDISKKLITSACYNKQHVCAYLQPFSRQTSQWRQNNVFFGWVPLFSPRSWGPSKPSGIKFCHKILETLGYHKIKTQNSLSHLVLKRYRDVTDTRYKTPRQNHHS